MYLSLGLIYQSMYYGDQDSSVGVKSALQSIECRAKPHWWGVFLV